MTRSPLLGSMRFAAGTTAAGALIGGAEALFRGVPALYAVLFYATLWALGGTLASLALWALRRHGAGLLGWGAAIAGGLTGGVLTRFILWRDVYMESPDKALLAAAVGVAATLALGAVLGGLAALAERHIPEVTFAALPMTACALFAGLAYTRPELEPDLPHANRPSQAHGVILVVADALRADALGAYGAPPHRGRPITPQFDALAERGALYTNASAQASWTKPAMASLLTSRYVRGHGTMSKTATLPQALPTLASELQRHGVHTGAVVTNYNLEPAFGFHRGFDSFEYLPAARYLNAPPNANRLAAYNVYRLLRERLFKRARQSQYFYRSGSWVNAAALRLIDQHPTGSFFLWLHYMEAHDPYFDEDGSTSWARVSDPHPQGSDAPGMQRAYLDGVRRWDNALGDLLAGLRARGLDDTLVVLTADHGEEFGEHGGFYHGTSLYEELLHVPLLLASPNLAHGTHEELVQQIDVAPTILQHFGIDPPAAWEGAPLGGGAAARDLAWAEEDHEGHVLSSVRMVSPEGEAMKLIVANPDNPRGLPPQALYDLNKDAEELTPLPSNDVRMQKLETQLTSLQDPNRRPPAAPERRLDSAAQAELRSLGYVQ